MRKFLISSSLLLALTLVGCQNTTPEKTISSTSTPKETLQQESSSKKEEQDTSTKEKEAPEETASDTDYQVKIPKDAPHKQHFVNAYLDFKDFQLEEVKGKPKSGNRFEFELEWRNLTNENKVFSDVGTVTILQNDQKADIIYDDDFNDSLEPQDDEDFEGAFVLDGDTFTLVVEDKAGKKVTFEVTLTD